MRFADGTISLTIADTSKEKPLHLIEKDSDDIEEFGIVRSALDCRVHQHAAPALFVGKRPFDDFSQKRDDGFAGRQAGLYSVDALAKCLVQISVQRAHV